MNIRPYTVVSNELSQRLARLNQIVLELMPATTLDELFRQAVELGMQELGFARLEIVVLDENPEQIYKTYGTNHTGKLCERDHNLSSMESHPALIRYLQTIDLQRAVLLDPAILNSHVELLSTHWKAVAGLWEHETLIGYLFADNLLCRRPLTEADRELLTLYATSISHLAAHLRLEQSLENRRFAASTFFNKMAALHQVTLQLTRSRHLDELCHSAVQLGRHILGFDRLGLWFIGEEPDTLVGAYGIDEFGNVRAEHGHVVRLEQDHDQVFGRRLQNNERYIFDTSITIRDFGRQPLGVGWKAAAALWDGEQIIGYLFTDNLLSQAPYSAHQGELLALYAMSIGHLCSRQRIEESLRKREASYRSLVDAIPDYTFVVNRAGQIVTYHEAQPPTLQIALEDCIGEMIFDVLSQDQKAHYLAAIEEAFVHGQVTTFEYPLHYQETLYHLEARIIVGNNDQAVVLVRDVTDRKRLEEQLYAAQKMESLGRMAGSIAHDFNNYLTVIQGFSGLAKSMATDVSPNLFSALERIESAGAKAARLTNQLLLFARKQAVTPQYLEVNQATLGVKPILLSLLGNKIKCQIDLDPAVGYTFMDAGQFEQILVNLAVNARDAMVAEGCLSISTHRVIVTEEDSTHRGHIPPNRYIVVNVRDSGSGMDDEVKKQIFEPFFTTKEKGKGTGLGLSICHSIIQQNGGYIQVESTVGEGTTFTIYLPQVILPGLAFEQPSAEILNTDAGTILLVEDDNSVREVVDEVLSTQGYTVLACASGPAALDIARNRTNEINLLMVDLTMPQMGGQEVAEQFMRIVPGVPILVVSGHVNGLPENLLNRPNVRFLPKPYTTVTLIESVRRSVQ